MLISIGTIGGPIGVVGYEYRDNLVQMMVPTQINDIVGGNSNGFFAAGICKFSGRYCSTNFLGYREFH